ncbi:MAG TPA: helicase, partial [Acetobacterium sp.]
TYERLENAKIELNKPFAQDDELNVRLLRLKELNNLLSMEKTKDPEENDVDIEEESKEPENIKNKEANDVWEMEA